MTSGSATLIKLDTRVRFASRVVSLVLLLTSILVLLGWAFDVRVLKGILPGLATMKANTALCIGMAGLALLLKQNQNASHRQIQISKLCCLGVILFAFATLVEYGANVDLRIDELLVADVGSPDTSYPGRPSAASALALLFFGTALLLLDNPRTSALVDGLTLSGAFLALLSLVGYAYSVSALYAVPSFNTIALHTTLSFLLLAAGIFFARPGRGVMVSLLSNTSGGYTARRLLPAAIAIPFVVGWLRLLGEQLGLYQAAFGLALFAVTNIILLSALVLWTASSLTQLELKRRRIEQSELLLATAIELSEDAIITKTLGGIINTWNLGAEKVFGYRRDEVIGKPISIVIPAELLHEESRILDAVRQAERIKSYDTRRIRKDGSLIDVSVSVSPIIDAAGRIVGASKIARDITAQVQMAMELARTQERFKATFEQAPVGIAHFAPDGHLISANPTLCNIVGYSAEELLVKGLKDITHPDDLASDGGYIQPMLAGTIKSHSEERRYFHKDGRLVWISLHVSLVSTVSGAPDYFIAVIHNISRRKRAEEAFRQSEELFSKAFRLSPDCVVITRLSDRVVIRANEALGRLWGSAPEEVIGKPGRDYADWLSEEERLKFMRSLQDTGECLGYEATLRLADGRSLDFNISSRLITFNEESCILTVMRDITERKQAEAALRDSEERFRTMANSMNQLAWIARADGYIFWYNQRWYEYTGTTPEEMEGWGWQSVHDPRVLASVMDGWKYSIDAGETFEMEFPLRGADGTFRTFLTRGQPLKDSEGRVVQWFGTNTDVEALKQVEERIQQNNAELEQRVAERTAQLEGANNELEAFSYSVSHDLRAPLRAVSGYVRILQEDYGDRLDAEGHRLIDVVRTEARHMGQLIDDLLSFSRLSRQQMARTSVDMSALARTVFEGLVAAGPETAPRFDLKALPPAEGDLPMLRQVFVNLIGNAIKFSRRKPTPVVEVGYTEDPRPRKGTTGSPGPVYYVKDNGAGFDEQYSHKLFGVFQRLHSEAEFEGTGVGLSLVHRIIQRHNGRIWGEGERGEGATFYFSLPRGNKEL